MSFVIYLALSTLGGFTLGYVYCNRKKIELDEISSILKERNAWKDAAEKYKKIATNRDVNFIEPKLNNWTKTQKLFYSESIARNFENLKRDLIALNQPKILIKTKVFCIGEWARWLAGKRNYYTDDKYLYSPSPDWNFTNPGEWDIFGKLSQNYEGSPLDVCERFKKFLQDPYWGLWVGDSRKNEWLWARNSAIKFEVTVYVPGEPNIIRPEIRYIEVAVDEPDDNLRRLAELEVENLLKLGKISAKLLEERK